jgi:hypothetical protein
MFDVCPFQFNTTDVRRPLNVDAIKEGLKEALDTARYVNAQPSESANGVTFAEADACIGKLWCDVCGASYTELLVWTPLIYLTFWGLPYYLIVFHVLKDWIRENDLGTLFKQLCRKEGPCWFISKRFSDEARPFVYIFGHLAFAMVTGSLAFVFWHCFWANTVFLVFLIVVGVYNGGSYVFADLSLNYATRIYERHKEKFDQNDKQE